MKKNKILIITERFYPEEFGINELAVEWRCKGYKVSVLTQTPSYPFDKVYEGYRNKFFQKDTWRGIDIYRVFSLPGYKKNVFLKVLNYLVFAFLTSVAGLFIARKQDRVFVYQTGPLTQAIPAVLMKKILKKKIFIWTLDVWPDTVYAYGFKSRKLSKYILDWFVAIIYENFDSIFVSCKGFKDKVAKYAPNIEIIYSPQWSPNIDNTQRLVSEKLLKEGFNFTFAGNIGKVQNLENLIEGFSLIRSFNNVEVNLNIIGDGSNLENLKSLVGKRKISNVFFWGRKPLKEMSGWLKASDVLIISLLDKPIFALTIPAKFQAYLAACKPIFCVMKGETADLVIRNNLGFIADADDLESIKVGFECFFNLSKKAIEEVGNNGKLLLNKEFNKDEIVQKMTEKVFL